MTSSKTLIVISVVLLTLSALFGVLNKNKASLLRADAERSEAARQEADRLRIVKEQELKAAAEAAKAKQAETEAKIANAEAELVKTQTEKNDLQAKLDANQAEIAQLQKRIEEVAPKPVIPGGPPGPSAAELEAQLEEARKQLDSAEREKGLLLDKMRVAEERATELENERKRRAAGNVPGVRGTVLAVNQAYNFVVLNLGGRQGLETNTEMLVLRGGSLIGKIRVSSVEPATAIGDIITHSLARGVQVQPGDTVIYAGTSS